MDTDQSSSSNLTLWQFLLELLKKDGYQDIICWTNNEGEFKLVNAEEVARLWGLKKNKENMNYDKLSRALRYYYEKNIIKKVLGQKFVYKFVSLPEHTKLDGKPQSSIKVENFLSASPDPGSPYSPRVSNSPMPTTPSPAGSNNSMSNSLLPVSTSQPLIGVNGPPPVAHQAMYQNMAYAAYHMAMVQSMVKFGSSLERSNVAAPLAQPWQTTDHHHMPQYASPAASSEDSKDSIDVPLHLVTAESSRRRETEEAEEKMRQNLREKEKSPVRQRSPFRSPAKSPVTVPTSEESKNKPVKIAPKPRNGPKYKPCPLTIDPSSHSQSINSPRYLSASTLNTPVVSMPSPPYSVPPVTSPYSLLPHLLQGHSPLGFSLSPHVMSPVAPTHFTFPSLQYQSHLMSPLFNSPHFDFASIKSPKDKPSTVPIHP